MENNLPKSDQEADKRLVTNVAYYVREKQMPINVAAQIMDFSIRNKNNYSKLNSEFKNLIKQNGN